MNKKGFTLVELLATLLILGIVIGITVVSVNSAFGNAKEKSEDAFIATIEDALDIFLDTDAKDSSKVGKYEVMKIANDEDFTISKTHGSVRLWKTINNLTFQKVIDSDYHPIIAKELVNPANKDSNDPDKPFNCVASGTLNIYKDDDGIYYYLIDKADFKCLNTSGYITNLPCDVLNKMTTELKVGEGLDSGKIPSRCN